MTIIVELSVDLKYHEMYEFICNSISAHTRKQDLRDSTGCFDLFRVFHCVWNMYLPKISADNVIPINIVCLQLSMYTHMHMHVRFLHDVERCWKTREYTCILSIRNNSHTNNVSHSSKMKHCELANYIWTNSIDKSLVSFQAVIPSFI